MLKCCSVIVCYCSVIVCYFSVIVCYCSVIVCYCRFDVVFNLAGDETALKYVKPTGWFLAANSPLLKAADDWGLVCGSVQSSYMLTSKVTQVRGEERFLYFQFTGRI